MRRMPLVLGSLLAAGCHAEVPNAVPATASVDVAVTAAGPETHFRGHMRVDLAPLDVVEPGGGRKAIAVSAHAEDKEILGCFRSLSPAPTDVWMVARATKSGTIEDASVVTSVPAPVADCAKKTLGKLAIATDRPVALSFSLHLEPAPADCRGDACFAIATPPAMEGAEPFPHAFGAGTDVGGGFGQGGLGLTGIGEGGGGTGEGTIGLGTFGTLGHGDGGVTPVQQSSAIPTSRPTRMKDSGSTVAGRLPPDVIKRIVRQNFGNMRGCYERGLSATPNLRGKVVVHFTIATDGSVSKAASTESTTMPDAAMVACVTKVFASLAFPEPEGGVVNVTYPISFDPGDDAKAPPSDAGKSSNGPKPDERSGALQNKREFSMIGLLSTDGARLTVNGVGFPQLTASDVIKKLAANGWRTAIVEGNVAGAPFVVFAAAPNAPTSSVAKPEGFITSVRRLPQPAADAPNGIWATETSEGVALQVEGGDADAANRALIDPPAPTK